MYLPTTEPNNDPSQDINLLKECEKTIQLKEEQKRELLEKIREMQKMRWRNRWGKCGHRWRG
jgi:hypothetical protein